jgi:uncharacterized membrane protein YfcA
MWDSPLACILVGFVIALVTTPAGVSGAFLLLPFQVSVLGFVAPSATSTNLLFNVFSTPGGVVSYIRQGSLDRALVTRIVAGAAPGVVVGSILRVTLLEDPSSFKRFVGAVLAAIGVNLLVQVIRPTDASMPAKGGHPLWRVTVLAGGAGVVGGIYGISGGSIIAPMLVGVFGLSVKRVAPAALVATLLTSVVGVASFIALDVFGGNSGVESAPDWTLALWFGIGGAAGSATGARLHVRAPALALRVLLGVLATAVGLSYLAG